MSQDKVTLGPGEENLLEFEAGLQMGKKEDLQDFERGGFWWRMDC